MGDRRHVSAPFPLDFRRAPAPLRLVRAMLGLILRPDQSAGGRLHDAQTWDQQAMRQLMMVLVSCLGVLLAPDMAQAKKHALLIGVAQYDDPAIRSLSGPRNDVILLWRYLTANGFDAADVRVLAEGLPQGPTIPTPFAAPTRAQIVDGLRDLAARAQASDFVIVHYSGHGTTQPETARSAASNPEAGDRDQVLLPKDAGAYDKEARTIRNGVVDDEIGDALDAIRAKGATVWAIVDACHAGTVTRSGAVMTRGTQPQALGVPASPALRSAHTAAPTQRSALVKDMSAKASLIGFFAVDSWTEAIEREFQFSGEFAPGPNNGPPRFGVFTYHLVRALNSGRARTYRDLARIVSLDIASSGAIAQSPLPFFDGDLDLPLAGGDAQYARRFPTSVEDGKLVIDAGALQGFDENAEVGLFDGPLDDAKRLGSARIASADAARAIAEFDGATRATPGLWASVEAPGIALQFRVAIVAGEQSAQTQLQDILREALKTGDAGLAVNLVQSGERDVDIRLEDGQIWLTNDGRPFVKDQQSYDRSLAIPLAGQTTDQAAGELRKALFAYARAANLVRVASAAEIGGAPNDDVQITFESIRETDAQRRADSKRVCGKLSRPAAPSIVASGDPTPLNHCDEVLLTVTNRSERDLFVGVFYLTPTGGVALPVNAWRQDGCIRNAPARATRPLTVRTPIQTWSNDGPIHAGIYRVLVFAIPRTQATALNLCHLLQPDVAAARKTIVTLRNKVTRKGLLGLIDKIAGGEPSLRTANPFENQPEDASNVLVRQYTLDVRAPAEN